MLGIPKTYCSNLQAAAQFSCNICSHKLTTHWKWTHPLIFDKKSCKWKQIKVDQTPASVNVLKHCVQSPNIFQNGMKLFWKGTSKRNYAQKRRLNDFSFWCIKNLSKTDFKKSTIFCLSKTHQNKHIEVA